jgi:ribonuclease P protein component
MPPPRLDHLLRAADFERLLKTPSRARSTLFALHHLASFPSQPAKPPGLSRKELSTGDAPEPHKIVDECPATLPQGYWLGFVVPKRLAKRAVTRNLIRRVVRASFQGQLDAGLPFPAGLWALRLRAPIDKKQFKSAKSDALRAHLHEDLAVLWRRTLNPRPPRPAGAPAA